MMNILKNLLIKSDKINPINLAFKKLNKETKINKIFKTVEKFSENSEIRYVGGCVRKIINNEVVDDIDLAVNLTPSEISKLLNNNNIKFYETGIEHGTITALIDQNKFEITSLRKDIETDGRHAKVEFSNNWHQDASRRDFSINAIYADINGNLFDPFNGKSDLKNGVIKFIGNEEKRIQEDYLRVLRYIRFFLNYSKVNHEPNITKAIKKNLDGLSKISPERLLDEFKKLSKSTGFLKLSKDKFCLEIISLVFPQFKNINILKNLTNDNFNNLNFIILISLLTIDASDNTQYFLYKFNISKNDQKRILFLNSFFPKINDKKMFFLENLWKIFYLNGKQALFDLLRYKIFQSNKNNKKFLDLIQFFQDKEAPLFPIKAKFLIEKYKILEGKELGIKLKKLEGIWLNNNFKISDKEIKKLFN